MQEKNELVSLINTLDASIFLLERAAGHLTIPDLSPTIMRRRRASSMLRAALRYHGISAPVSASRKPPVAVLGIRELWLSERRLLGAYDMALRVAPPGSPERGLVVEQRDAVKSFLMRVSTAAQRIWTPDSANAKALANRNSA